MQWKNLQKIGYVKEYERTNQHEIVQRCMNAHIILSNKLVFNKQILQQLKKTKIINVMATGYNCIDVKFARHCGITVCNASSYSSESVAQLVFSHILNISNRVEYHSQLVKEGYWQSFPDFTFQNSPQIEINGKTLGIVGFGQIGQVVNRIAKFGFNMKVIVYTRTKRCNHQDIIYVDKETLFKNSDFLTLHCPLTNETLNFVCKQYLDMMKKEAVIINTSRGQCINESDLFNALNEGKIKAACLDVLSEEPPKQNILINAKNCFITPHMGWATIESKQRLIDICENNIQAFLNGNPVNVVN